MQSNKNPISLSPKLTPALYLFFLGACALWLGGHLPYHNDLLVYDYPERTFNLESLRSGLIPLWNPYLACGLPHMANWQSAFFYPPYWLLTITGVPKGLVILALLHGAWAFLGFFLWARSQKITGWVPALGALSFAGSAHLIHCWVNLHFIATASWIPWVFLTVHQAVQCRRLKETLLAVLVLSLQLLAGYPSFVFYTWIVLLLWLAFEHPLPFVLSRVALLLGAALLVTSLQWFPFLEFLTYATHDHWTVFPYYTHPWEYLTLFHPTLLGTPNATGYLGDSTNSIYGNLYFGLVPCLVWAASLLFKRNRAGIWGPLSLLLLVWMAGPSLFLWKFIPMEAFTRLEPSKAVGLFLFTACTSLCRFLSLDSPGKSPSKSAWVWLLAALWLLDLLVLPFRLTSRVPDAYQNPVLQQQVEKVRKETGQGRILALQTSTQMSVEGRGINEGMQEKLSRIFPDNLLPNTNMVWGLRTVTGYFSLQTEGLKDIMRYLNHGFPYSGDLLEVAGVRAFLLPQPLPAPKYRLVGKIGENDLSVDPGASEDLRWVRKAEEFSDRPVVLNALAGTGGGWRQKVYLEKDDIGDFLQLPPVSRPLAVVPTKDIDRPSGGRLLGFIGASAPGYVVFNDSFAPGWHAWVDGKPAPILRAYGLFMAVAVDKGNHQVEFRYEPTTFRLGLFITLITLALFSVGLLKTVPSSIRGSGRTKKR